MEQQKILWVSLSLTLLFAVIIASALILFKDKESVQVSHDTPRQAAAGGEMVQPPMDPVAMAREEAVTPSAEDLRKDTEQPEGLTAEPKAAAPLAEEKTAISIQSGVPQPGSSSATQVAQQGQKSAANTGTPSIQKKIYSTSPQPQKKTAAKTTGSPVKPAPPREKWITEYWIQVGSFSSLYGATQVQEKLSAKNFTGLIKTKTTDGLELYRVRIGPYANKAEADKFLQWVRAIKGFEESYVSKVTQKKRL